MRIALDIPDEFAALLPPGGRPSERAALEALVIDAYRGRRITAYQAGELLGITSRYQLDGFLKEHGVWLDYSVEEFERDRATTEGLRAVRSGERSAG
jgi:predicted HTH domain antitoxin